ncbi:helix-turn-helix domain-containing protein [Mycobacterium sp. CBMA247]|nr:helix-turn-helix domain-containing protein [Mycolicibacterium sp. CBMA 329]MUL86613.1 helix-turn-helix domain-containing protein [Mycolicibacterium sp. CBMA 331]MUM02818.1 helix-turn-helix domain-containing protein [Mycolicibacterium sp. CBMA 334]MUM26309.1 helix-turn-helix domain-containing protein [Mycolicibacterium sp. CBMA 295]MUM36910.1 helix-turn-helix domain-containing protein [Mycolicibacterium sp. CBMA 247]MUM42678.1 helix-turn-helix domain-containing protein [Mycolicibacterium sp.
MVTPHDVGLPTMPRRRVDGLRREEVAEIVGLSTDYYVRLEQGRAQHPSAEVLDALCRALLLGPAERVHLLNLARTPGRPSKASPEHRQRSTLRSSLRHAVSSIHDAPALIMNDRSDVLAWNDLAAALIADFPRLPPAQRNMAWQIFLNPQAPEIHPDWNDAAQTTVGILRMAVGRRSRDTALTHLIGELSVGNQTFAKLWATQHVHEKTHGSKKFRHKLIGEFSLTYETFHIPASDDYHVLVIYTAAPHSPEHDLLNRLSATTTDTRDSPAADASTTP